ncbi:MAG TPA: TatD family hydrolase [Bacteroidales bacterium]|nr:TatD family hydrolase [Bacteroidales bacterium]
MQLIDTHTHLYLPEFDEDRDEIVKRALSNGVVKLFMPNIDTSSVDKMLEVQKAYPGVCYSMSGLHPTSVDESYPQQLKDLEKLHDKNNLIAVGEIGIDLYWDKSHINEQVIAFRRQCEFALSKNLPVVIHSRESFTEVFSVLEEFKGTNLKGVFHAFTGGSDEAQKAIDLGYLLGIGGIVTFKNSGLGSVIKNVPLQKIILETDSPYLAPVPHRGKRNESSYICIINKRIADIKGIKEEEVADTAFSNSLELFNLAK